MYRKTHHRKVDCSSESSVASGYCANACGNNNGCVAPFQPLANIFDVSSLKCSDNDCDRQVPSNMCSSEDLSKCPELSHCVRKPKPKKEKKCKDKKGCGECGYKKCQCDMESRDWSAVLCGSSSDECSDSEGCKIPVPIAPCNVVKNRYWDASCRSDSSSDEGSDSDHDHHGKHEKKHDRHHNNKRDECAECCYPHDRCRCKSQLPSKEHMREFSVEFGPKAGHPWQHRILGSEAILVDRIPGRPIHVTRGHKYRFVVKGNGTDHFYFTHDVQGGRRGVQSDSPLYDPVHLPGTPSPVPSGEVVLDVTSDLPKMFYYQSRNNNCMGGHVFVHEK